MPPGSRRSRAITPAFPEPKRRRSRLPRTMTLSADAVTDAEVAELKSLFGEEKLTAIVLLLAYANFQDRLLLALDLPIDPGGPQAPPEIRFTKGRRPRRCPPREKIEGRVCTRRARARR